MARATRTPRVHSSNVLLDVGGETHLWTFAGAEARPSGGRPAAASETLPASLVGKGWRQLVQPRVNIAWISDQPLFLQLVHLPTDDPAEVPGMLEIQLEKISPLPVGQIVWSYEILPQRPTSGLSVLAVVAERSGIDTMLAGLERRGFLTDRIESPLVPLITGADFSKGGAYIFFFRIGPRQTCLIGWAAEGALRALNVVNVASDERWLRQLLDEMNRLAWAGELEGWANPESNATHLVADEETIATWREPLENALGSRIEVQVRPPDQMLAAASAARATRGTGQINLLPEEFGVRYRQQFTDHLWMGGLGTLFAAYLAGLLVYFGAVEFQKYRQSRRADELAAINSAYTNTLHLKAQAQVLQETVNLRYAALDCWLATVEAMPEELSLENLTFSGGRSVVISGTAPADQDSRITEFWQSLRRKVVGNTNLFSEVQLRPTQMANVRGTPQIRWSFTCTIQRPEI